MPLKVVEGRHGSPNLYLRGSVRGFRIDESTGTSDPEAADEIRIKREAALLKRSIHGDSAVRTFAEAAASYLEAGGDGEHLPRILKHFGGRRLLANVGQAEIDHAAKTLYPNAANSTRNRKVYTPISAVLHHAARKGWCPAPVIARPAQAEPRVRWIRYEEADRLVAAAAPHLAPLITFLLATGARVSEALYMDWRQVDLGRAHVTILNEGAGGHGTKSGESRGVPLHPRAVAALANLPWEREGAVFRRPAGKIKKAGRVWLPYESRDGEGGGQIKTGFGAACRRAGIENFTPHDCRHTWATWHYAANRDLRALMELGGWKSLDMVLRYAHVNMEHLAPSIGAIWPTSKPANRRTRANVS